MGTTADKLVYLEETKADIRAALVEKGLDVPENTPFREYGDLIRGISGDSLATVGDVKFTVRKDLGSDWLLCDGSMVDLENYPGLDICMQGTSDWEKITMPSDFGTTYNTVLAANDLLFVVGASDALWYSTNPKGPWTKKADTLSGLYNKRFVYFAGKYCSVDYNGNMYTTPDMGTNWTKASKNPLGIYSRKLLVAKERLFSISGSSGNVYLKRIASYADTTSDSVSTGIGATGADMVTDGESVFVWDGNGNVYAKALLDAAQDSMSVTTSNVYAIGAAATKSYFFVADKNGKLYRSKSIADFMSGNREVFDIQGDKYMFADGEALMISTPGAENCKIINGTTMEVLKTPEGITGEGLYNVNTVIGKNGAIGMKSPAEGVDGVYAPKQNHLTAPQLPNLVGNGSLAYIKAK